MYFIVRYASEDRFRRSWLLAIHADHEISIHFKQTKLTCHFRGEKESENFN